MAKGDWTLGDMSSLLLPLDDRSLVSPLASPSVLPVEGSAREGMLGVVTNEDIGVSREEIPTKPREPFLAIPAVKGDTSMLPTDGPAPLRIEADMLDEYESEFNFGEPMERGGGLFEMEDVPLDAPSPPAEERPRIEEEASPEALLGDFTPVTEMRVPEEPFTTDGDEAILGGITPRSAPPTGVDRMEKGPSEEASLSEIKTPLEAGVGEISGPSMATISGEARTALSEITEPASFEGSFSEPEALAGMAEQMPRERSDMSPSAAAGVQSDLEEISGTPESRLGELLSVLEPDGLESAFGGTTLTGGVPTFEAEKLAQTTEALPEENEEIRASIESWLGREATSEELQIMMPEAGEPPAAEYYALEGIDYAPPTPSRPTSSEEEPPPSSDETVERDVVRTEPSVAARTSSGSIIEGAVAQEIRDKIVRDGGAVNSKLMEQMSKEIEDRLVPLREGVLQQASETAKGLVNDGIDDFTRGA